MKYLLGLVFIVVLATCSKRVCGCDPVSNGFAAKVLDTSLSSCGRPHLLFDDSTRVSNYLGIPSARYIVDQIPDSLKTVGKRMWVAVKTLPSNEDFTCSGSGPTYPHLKVLWATGNN